MKLRAALVATLLIASALPASADVGIGLKWVQESAVVPQGTISCINYGLYNPFDTDVEGSLAASRELAPLISAAHSDSAVPVVKGTMPESAIWKRVCFSIPVAYPTGGVGPLFPSQVCPPDPERRVYAGEVAALSKPFGGPTKGVGSATGTSVAAPLRLIVGCAPFGTDFATPADLALYAVIALVVASLVRKYRKPPEVRRQEKAERLKRQLAKLQNDMGRGEGGGTVDGGRGAAPPPGDSGEEPKK